VGLFDYIHNTNERERGKKTIEKLDRNKEREDATNVRRGCESKVMILKSEHFEKKERKRFGLNIEKGRGSCVRRIKGGRQTARLERLKG